MYAKGLLSRKRNSKDTSPHVATPASMPHTQLGHTEPSDARSSWQLGKSWTSDINLLNPLCQCDARFSDRLLEGIEIDHN